MLRRSSLHDACGQKRAATMRDGAAQGTHRRLPCDSWPFRRRKLVDMLEHVSDGATPQLRMESCRRGYLSIRRFPRFSCGGRPKIRLGAEKRVTCCRRISSRAQ